MEWDDDDRQFEVDDATCNNDGRKYDLKLDPEYKLIRKNLGLMAAINCSAVEILRSVRGTSLERKPRSQARRPGAILTDVVARKSYDQACAFPQFCGAAVCGTRCFSDGYLIVLALNN
jgi:hypothetical protein